MKNYRYEITENKFHGGAHIAYSNTLINAVKTANRNDSCARSGCCCGGPNIIALTDDFKTTDDWVTALHFAEEAVAGNTHFAEICKRNNW
jgi:hypothetical protein